MEKKERGFWWSGKTLRLLGFSIPMIAVLAAAVIFAVVAGGLLRAVMAREGKKEIVTVSALEKIVNVSELSTFTAVYNGIAQVMDEKKTDDVDYYVSYEATVNAGINFEKIAFQIDNEAKTIRIGLPEVHITKLNVDIASLDYIFYDEKKNASSVTEEAYKACEDDVQNESEKADAILRLAKENAETIVRALVEPFVEQLDAAYTLDIDWEE